MSQPSAGEYVRPIDLCKKCNHSRNLHEPDLQLNRISVCKHYENDIRCSCIGFESI